MDFRLLGPLEVVDDDGVVLPLGGPRPRALLAQLLLHPNEVVSTDRLIDGIWGETPPASATNALQVHVHTLRSALGADRIVTRAPGYLLRVEDGELDAQRFEQLVRRREAGRGARALARARARRRRIRAVRPGGGRAPRGARGSPRSRHESTPTSRRGVTPRLAAELEALVAEHPHRERLRAQQMLALYRAGRQADALAAYRDARGVPRRARARAVRRPARARAAHPPPGPGPRRASCGPATPAGRPSPRVDAHRRP